MLKRLLGWLDAQRPPEHPYRTVENLKHNPRAVRGKDVKRVLDDLERKRGRRRN